VAVDLKPAFTWDRSSYQNVAAATCRHLALPRLSEPDPLSSAQNIQAVATAWISGLVSSGSWFDNRCSATVSTGCGGHILVAMIGPQVKAGFKSTATYHHPSVLRTMLEALGTTANFPSAQYRP